MSSRHLLTPRRQMAVLQLESVVHISETSRRTPALMCKMNMTGEQPEERRRCGACLR